MFIFSYLEYYPSTNISHNQERTEKVEKGWGRGVETQGVWQMEKYFFVFVIPTKKILKGYGLRV